MFSPWDRKIPLQRQSTPVFLPGEFHDQRCLVGYSSWSCKEWDMTKWLILSLSLLWYKSFAEYMLCKYFLTLSMAHLSFFSQHLSLSETMAITCSPCLMSVFLPTPIPDSRSRVFASSAPSQAPGYCIETVRSVWCIFT